MKNLEAQRGELIWLGHTSSSTKGITNTQACCLPNRALLPLLYYLIGEWLAAKATWPVYPVLIVFFHRWMLNLPPYHIVTETGISLIYDNCTSFFLVYYCSKNPPKKPIWYVKIWFHKNRKTIHNAKIIFTWPKSLPGVLLNNKLSYCLRVK